VPNCNCSCTVIPTRTRRSPPTLTIFIPSATVKLDSQETPPPLCYSPIASDRGRESTADTTPVSTPVERAASPHFGRQKKDSSELYFSWRRKPHELGASRSPLFESDILFEDAGDCSFPLFTDGSPHHSTLQDMAQTAGAIDITTPPRFGSNSPQNQTSNLTSALREAAANRNLSVTPNAYTAATADHRNERPSLGVRQDSNSNGFGSSLYGSAARPISMKDRGRRESNTMGSFAGGMSWGGLSVGSWIREEYVPYPYPRRGNSSLSAPRMNNIANQRSASTWRARLQPPLIINPHRTTRRRIFPKWKPPS
jgi:transcription factor SFP1